MSQNTGIYQIGRLERKIEAVTTWSLECGGCDNRVAGDEPGGILAVTLARELHQKGWTFRDTDDGPRCPDCTAAAKMTS